MLAVGWTGIAPLVTVVDQLLQSAWSLAESLADVRILMDGGRVVLLKSPDEYKKLLTPSTKK